MMRSARGGRSSLVIGPYTSSIPDHTRGAVCVYTCVDRHIHYTCVEGSVRKSRECKSVDKEAPVANIYKMEVTSVTSSTSSPGATVQIRTSSYAPCTGLHSSAECENYENCENQQPAVLCMRATGDGKQTRSAVMGVVLIWEAARRQSCKREQKSKHTSQKV